MHFSCFHDLRQRVLVAISLTLTFFFGCDGQPAATPPATPQAVAASPDNAVPAETPAVAQVPEENIPTETIAPQASSESPQEVVAANLPSSGPPELKPLVEHLILFAPGGPVVLEIEIQVAGKALAAAFEEIAAQAQSAADTDGDGRPTWSEVLASTRFQAGEFGNLPFKTAAEQKQITDRYDLDKDSLVDREELPRFLTRNAGGARPFSFRGTSEWRFKNRRSAPVWQLIDQNHDGSLDDAEITSLPAALRLRDVDEDELLMPQELQTAVADNTETRSRFRGIAAGMVLTTSTDWTALRLALEQHYALGRDLQRENLAAGSRLFDHLDANQNGRLERSEFSRILDIPADLRLRLELDRDSETGDSPWQVMRQSAELRGKVESCTGGLVVRMPECVLKIVLNDTVGASNYRQQAEQLVMQYDANANGYLEKEEIPEIAAATIPFDAVDQDGNEKLFADEIASLLERQQSALRCQVHVKGSDREDAVFAWLDGNADERLDMREIQAGVKQLQELRAATNAPVHGDQLPNSMLLVFARGNLETADALFVPPTTVITAATDRPAWFVGMDVNRDGTISTREFLGSAEQFRDFDANHDDYLTWEEFPAEMRTSTTPDSTPPSTNNDE